MNYCNWESERLFNRFKLLPDWIKSFLEHLHRNKFHLFFKTPWGHWFWGPEHKYIIINNSEYLLRSYMPGIVLSMVYALFYLIWHVYYHAYLTDEKTET